MCVQVIVKTEKTLGQISSGSTVSLELQFYINFWKFIGWRRLKPNNSMQLSAFFKTGQAGNYNKNGGINFDLLPKRVWLGEIWQGGSQEMLWFSKFRLFGTKTFTVTEMYWFGGLAKNSRVCQKVLRQHEKRGENVKLDITDTDRQMFKWPGKV